MLDYLRRLPVSSNAGEIPLVHHDECGREGYSECSILSSSHTLIRLLASGGREWRTLLNVWFVIRGRKLVFAGIEDVMGKCSIQGFRIFDYKMRMCGRSRIVYSARANRFRCGCWSNVWGDLGLKIGEDACALTA